MYRRAMVWGTEPNSAKKQKTHDMNECNEDFIPAIYRSLRKIPWQPE